MKLTKRKVYLWLQAAVCIVLVAYLSFSAIKTYREGSARKAEHPMESIYAPEEIAEKSVKIAPLFFAGIGLMIAGIVLGVKDERAEKPVKDVSFERDLLTAQAAGLSGAMLAEQRTQKRLRLTGWILFVLCMIPLLVYLLDAGHFPQNDPEAMFFGLIRVLLPWTSVGIGALMVTSALQKKSMLREIQAAEEALKTEKKAGRTEVSQNAGLPKKKAVLQVIVIIAAAAFIIAGTLNGSARDVLYKAVTICTECIGLG